jgi:ketosteroid isomerase-like protein
MSQENVEIVRCVFDAIARRDADALLALYDPEVEWDTSHSPLAPLGEGGVYHGYEGIRHSLRAYHEAWEHVEYEVEELIGDGDTVVSVVNTRFRGRTSGTEVELHFPAVWTIRDGKITRVKWFPTREEALEAAGLSG